MRHRFLLLICIATLYLAGNFLLNRWTFDLYYGDPNGYYLHLVSLFVNQDVGDYDKTITSLKEVNPASADPREDKYGIRLTDKGRRYIKYTLGVPLMETPFFLLAHAYAGLSQKYADDGWSRPYLLAISLSVIVYVLLGFYLLMLVLERYFSPNVVGLVILSIALATNLFFHATYTTMAHGFLFFDYCLLIYLSERFYRKPAWKLALAVGATVGLVTLTRVPEVISVFIPLLWGVINWTALKERIRFFLSNFNYLLWASAGFLIVFSIQLIYWYYVSGHLVFNPYEGEGFNFLKPRIYKAWFDFANGWLIYTPIMGLAIIGLFAMRKYQSGLLLPVLAFLIPHIWIHYSYYAWTYFPGLGQRPMVETYPILAFGLAAFFAFCMEKRWRVWLLMPVLLFFTVLNLFQTWQMKEGVIWTERGNPAFYWETFGRLKPSLNSLRAYDAKVWQPDSSDIQWKKTLTRENFEDGTKFQLSKEHRFSGQTALFSQSDTIWINKGFPLAENISGDWLGFSIQAHFRPEDQVFNRDHCMYLMVKLYDEKGRRRKGVHIIPAAHIGNTDFNIWTTGRPNQWGKASFFMKMPGRLRQGWTLDLFLINPYGQKIYLDDFRVDHYAKI